MKELKASVKQLIQRRIETLLNMAKRLKIPVIKQKPMI